MPCTLFKLTTLPDNVLYLGRGVVSEQAAKLRQRLGGRGRRVIPSEEQAAVY